MKKRALLVLFLTPGFLVMAPVTPSEAASCTVARYTNTSEDYARITDVSGGCSEVRVRHQYEPLSASKAYWTSWKKGADVAQTNRQSELIVADWGYTS